MEGARKRRIESLRHELLELHRAVIDAQRIEYERTHGRVETSSQFLGLVLNHPEFGWIRSLSALIAQLDEWAEDSEVASDQELAGIVESLRTLIRPEAARQPGFGPRYWRMVEAEPDVTVAHVKVWRMIGSPRQASN